MASPKIKKKSTVQNTSAMPRQGAIPCLIILVVIFVVIGLFMFFGLRSAG